MWAANVSSECEWQLAMIGNYLAKAIWSKHRGRCLRLVVALAWRHSLTDFLYRLLGGGVSNPTA